MSGIIQPPLPRRDALKHSTGTPFYVTGDVAQDLCRLTGLSLDDEGRFLDVSRLDGWDYLRVFWAWVGGNYYAKCNPFPEPRAKGCYGCIKEWPEGTTELGFPIHYALDELGGVVGCSRVLAMTRKEVREYLAALLLDMAKDFDRYYAYTTDPTKELYE